MVARSLLATVGAVALLGAFVAAQQKPEIKMVPIQPTAVSDVRGMFTSYCAACHGPAGKGDGPAASALKKAPADLTTISARNGGKFPEVKVRRFIEGIDEVAAHGSRDMPVWGTLFRSLDITNQAAAQMRVQLLTDYLKSIQR
jgi:mono/diheme cytochrome c family protein